MRFADTAIVLRQPLLVGLTVVFVLAILIAGVGEIFRTWVGWALLLAIVPPLTWMLGYAHEVLIDPAARRVTQWHRFLNWETAKNEWGFADFTGVIVEQKTSKTESAATSPGSRGAYTSVKTTHAHSYTLSLLRADSVVTTPERQLNVPHYPLSLPTPEKAGALELEALARQVARLGGWPATRRGYVLLAGEARPRAAESPIELEEPA